MHNVMSKLWAKRAKGDKGFTLIELLVVVVILGVLIAVAIPLYLNYRKGANDSAAQSDLRNAISTLEICNTENSSYPTSTSFAITSGGLINNGCTTQKINLSANTSMTYKGSAAASPVVSYILLDTNSSGSGKVYCYNSSVGGAVKAVTPSTPADYTTGAC